MRQAVICEPIRTPVGSFGGSLRDVPAHTLASTLITALLERTGLPPDGVDDVLLGNCYPTMDAPAIGRVAALDAGLPVTEVADYTGFPEMLDGRVKTLRHATFHPTDSVQGAGAVSSEPGPAREASGVRATANQRWPATRDHAISL